MLHGVFNAYISCKHITNYSLKTLNVYCLHFAEVFICYKTALGKTSIAVRQWTVKQFWVDRQSFKQEEKVQISKLNVYLSFQLNYDVCYTYESCFYIFPIIKLN
jgi:hypothetical protein